MCNYKTKWILQSEYVHVTIIQTYKYNTQKPPTLFSSHYFHFLSKVGSCLTSKTIDKFLNIMDYPVNLAFFSLNITFVPFTEVVSRCNWLTCINL